MACVCVWLNESGNNNKKASQIRSRRWFVCLLKLDRERSVVVGPDQGRDQGNNDRIERAIKVFDLSPPERKISL